MPLRTYKVREMASLAAGQCASAGSTPPVLACRPLLHTHLLSIVIRDSARKFAVPKRPRHRTTPHLLPKASCAAPSGPPGLLYVVQSTLVIVRRAPKAQAASLRCRPLSRRGAGAPFRRTSCYNRLVDSSQPGMTPSRPAYLRFAVVKSSGKRQQQCGTIQSQLSPCLVNRGEGREQQASCAGHFASEGPSILAPKCPKGPPNIPPTDAHTPFPPPSPGAPPVRSPAAHIDSCGPLKELLDRHHAAASYNTARLAGAPASDPMQFTCR